MSRKLDGKVALVTGATSGIGKATAIALADAGASVVLGARRAQEGEAVAKQIRDVGGKAIFKQTDVANLAQVEALVQAAIDEFGRLDIAFNNAGVEGTGLQPIVEDTEENLDTILDINVKGVWRAMRAEIRAMGSRGGSIINTTSVAGIKGIANFATYSASKFAVEGLSRSVAQETAEAGIRVNTVAPGPIETAMLDRATGGDLSAFEEWVPLKRVGSVDEIARAVVFLASDDAAFITGHSLSVDGGMSA